jgi:tetratricopeptide (TPR) repeat protein
MSAWRLDEVQAAVEGGSIADLEVQPGDPNTRRQIERLEREVEMQPQEWENRVALARTLVQDGQFERAAQQLRTGLDLTSDPRVLSAIFFNLGVCEESQERWQQAAAAYEQCIFLMPQLFWGHYGLGVTLHRMGNHAAAMLSLRHALALDPGIEEAHQALAELYRDAGLLREAEAECLWLLDLDPDHLWAAQTLVALRSRLN